MITKQIISDFRKSQESFFYSSNESNHEYTPKIYTKSFTAFFEKSVFFTHQYFVNICYSAPRLTVFKTLNISGYLLNIKRFVYRYMLEHEDNRIRR